MNRYLFSHPSLNQESYSLTDKIKVISIFLNELPMVHTETLDNLLAYSEIQQSTMLSVSLNPYSHFIIDILYATDERNINLIATKLYRIHTHDYSKFVYGPALLVGSMDLKTFSTEKNHYSVPYEMIEQTFNLINQ